jgi:Rrf2 family iron-sulfur cluster assembly transcriptional regulator
MTLLKRKKYLTNFIGDLCLNPKAATITKLSRGLQGNQEGVQIMMLTTKGRYAVMAMTDIAIHGLSCPVNLQAIASRQGITLHYLEQLCNRLRQADLVQSVKGPGGGYRLAKPAEKISIAEIIAAVQESIKITRCADHTKAGCMADKTLCLTHDLWQGLGDHILEYLNAICLADVCDRRLTINVLPLQKRSAAC